MVAFRAPDQRPCFSTVDNDQLTLATLLTMAALTAATDLYARLIRRREERRREAMRIAAEASGLRGLVRVFVADESGA